MAIFCVNGFVPDVIVPGDEALSPRPFSGPWLSALKQDFGAELLLLLHLGIQNSMAKAGLGWDGRISRLIVEAIFC